MSQFLFLLIREQLWHLPHCAHTSISPRYDIFWVSYMLAAAKVSNDMGPLHSDPQAPGTVYVQTSGRLFEVIRHGAGALASHRGAVKLVPWHYTRKVVHMCVMPFFRIWASPTACARCMA